MSDKNLSVKEEAIKMIEMVSDTEEPLIRKYIETIIDAQADYYCNYGKAVTIVDFLINRKNTSRQELIEEVSHMINR